MNYLTNKSRTQITQIETVRPGGYTDFLKKIKIKRLINGEEQKTGSYEAEFDGSNLASGVYFYRLETEKFNETKKMVLIK